MKGRFTDDISPYSKERIMLYKVKCKCGHTLSFISNHFTICNHCGRKVWPNKQSEFKDKLMKELKKK